MLRAGPGVTLGAAVSKRKVERQSLFGTLACCIGVVGLCSMVLADRSLIGKLLCVKALISAFKESFR